TAGTAPVTSETSGGADSAPPIARNHFVPGRGGSSVIERPGALSSTPIAPVAIVIRSHKGRNGRTSGVPPARGSEIVTSPIRNCVWVQEFRKPPNRGAVATLRPPAEKRSPITSVGMVSRTARGLLLV